MSSNNRLTEIDIFDLISDIGVPFSDISDKDINECLEQNILLTTNSIYNSSEDNYSYKNNKIYDVLKISTIVNEINNNTYNYNYPIVIWADWTNDDGGHYTYDADGVGLYHIRAFYFCRKNIYMAVNHSG